MLVLTPLSRLLIAALFGRSIGEKALARQPDTITLAPTDPSRLRHAERLRAVVAEFQSAGFEDGGLHSIPEMPGVSVQLMAHRGDSMAAAIYDHPVAGLFFDTVSRYVDGSTCTYTTAPATGLKHRENTRVVSLPGAEPAALIQRAKRDRPQHGLKGCSPPPSAPSSPPPTPSTWRGSSGAACHARKSSRWRSARSPDRARRHPIVPGTRRPRPGRSTCGGRWIEYTRLSISRTFLAGRLLVITGDVLRTSRFRADR